MNKSQCESPGCCQPVLEADLEAMDKPGNMSALIQRANDHLRRGSLAAPDPTRFNVQQTAREKLRRLRLEEQLLQSYRDVATQAEVHLIERCNDRLCVFIIHAFYPSCQC